MHKGFIYLDVNTCRINLSRDVVFDENVFPSPSCIFPNDGARLRYEILLLPLSLCHDNSDSREAINKSTIDFPNHADYVIVQRNIIRSSASTYPIFYLILFLKLHFTKNCYLLCKSLYCRSGLVEGKKN